MIAGSSVVVKNGKALIYESVLDNLIGVDELSFANCEPPVGNNLTVVGRRLLDS